MAIIGIDVCKAKLDCLQLKDAIRRTGKAKVFIFKNLGARENRRCRPWVL